MKRRSEWRTLFDIAASILDHFEKTNGFTPEWSFGGGTALMLQIDHRESHDIDLFIADPQILPFLNPSTQGISLKHQPDSYTGDGTSVLKLAYQNMGEIDFICAGHIVPAPTVPRRVEKHMIALETPAEIIAKKVYYRGWNFMPRDMFDLAAVVERLGTDYARAAVSACGRERCRKALDTVEKATPKAVETINSQLMLRNTTRHLVANAQEMCREVLRQVMAEF